MTPEQNERLEELFAEASEVGPGSKRQSMLADVEKEDPEVAAELRSLLAAEEWSLPKLVPKPASEPEPVPFGPYRDLVSLGRGGFGSVYRAARVIGQSVTPVAIKFLTADVSSPDRLQLFNLERQVLAKLDHPNIAKLLDGGVTPEGRAYVAMEYVEGLPIDEYCDKRNLTINERLGLFGQLCDAVNYAHSRLVLHRDLKPLNILVTQDGAVKLLDFGIAGLMERETGSATGSGYFTITHASPEQILGKQLGVATDVYSLGVVLYQLLCGHLPLLSDAEPVAPSDTAVVNEKEVTSTRRTTAPALRRTLRGDLDAIVLKTLEKDPNERYGSAAALANDLERYRLNFPVDARLQTQRSRYRAGFWYRISKLARRDRWATALVLAAFLLLVLGSQRAGVANTEADRQRRHALAATNLARDLSRLMVRSYAQLRRADASAGQLRAVAEENSALISRLERLPEDVRGPLMLELISARISESGMFRDLRDPAARANTLDRAVESARTLWERMPGHPAYKAQYRLALRERITAHHEAGRETEALEDLNTLAALSADGRARK